MSAQLNNTKRQLEGILKQSKTKVQALHGNIRESSR
jgi:hypothetical protein